MTTPATASHLSLADVKAYYRQVFRPDMTTIVVVGDITPAKARALIDKAFDGWHASGPKPVTDLPPVPLNKPSAAAVPDQSRVQDEVTLAETIGLTRSHPDYYTLQVGEHILAGAFYATRLYHDLREETGLVYTVDAMIHAGKTAAVICDNNHFRVVIDGETAAVVPRTTTSEIHRYKANATDKRYQGRPTPQGR